MSHDPAEYQLASEPAVAPENGQPGSLRSGDWLGVRGFDLSCEDCMALMARYADKHFDLAIVDPPYGIGAGSYQYWDSNLGQAAASNTPAKKWDSAIPGPEYFTELRRVSREQIIWGGNYFPLPTTRCWVAWDKNQPEDASFGMFELAWVSRDGSPKMFRMYPSHVTQGKRIHPTQKPVELYAWLLARYAKPGQRVLDTHLGSGSHAIAAHYHGTHLTACEIDADYYAAAMARIQRETAQTTLFT